MRGSETNGSLKRIFTKGMRKTESAARNKKSFSLRTGIGALDSIRTICIDLRRTETINRKPDDRPKWEDYHDQRV